MASTTSVGIISEHEQEYHSNKMQGFTSLNCEFMQPDMMELADRSADDAIEEPEEGKLKYLLCTN